MPKVRKKVYEGENPETLINLQRNNANTIKRTETQLEPLCTPKPLKILKKAHNSKVILQNHLKHHNPLIKRHHKDI